MAAINLKRIREEKGLSQAELAEKSGVSWNLIARLETGNLGNPTLKTLIKLAEALGCKMDDLFYCVER